MKRLLAGAFALAFLAGAAFAQTRPSTPYPQATPDPVYPSQDVENAMKRGEDLNRRSDELRMTENFPVKNRPKNKELFELLEPLYRHSNDDERALMSADEADLAAFSGITKDKHAGIFKLIVDRGCADNVKVVDASVDCARYTMPGAGSGYSFRFEDYRMHHISDIVFRKGRFEALGVLNHGIMVDLGDVPVDSVTDKTEGVRYLAKVKASKDFAEAADLATKLTKGIKEDGYTYASILPVLEGHTYVIRSIAYDGEALRKLGKYTYNEMDLDERRDVLVVFRVVRLTDGREATIVWKRLDDSKAPKLKANKE